MYIVKLVKRRYTNIFVQKNLFFPILVNSDVSDYCIVASNIYFYYLLFKYLSLTVEINLF